MEKITSMNVYGVSRINGQDILTFSAVVDADGGYSVTKSVRDRAAYTENKEACDADFAAFEEHVASASSND